MNLSFANKLESHKPSEEDKILQEIETSNIKKL